MKNPGERAAAGEHSATEPGHGVLPAGLTALLLLATCALAFWLRSLNAAGVLDGDPLYLYDTDSSRHMRRIWIGALHYPKLPLFDTAYAFPHGLPLLSEIGYDFLLATLVWIGVGTSLDRHLAETICAWAQPALGALACAAIYLLGRQIAGRLAGLIAALLAAVMPALVAIARIGRVDHHSIEAPLALLCAAAAWSACFPERKSVGRVILAGSLLAMAVLCWSGAVVFAAILAVWGAVQHMANRARPRASVPIAESMSGILFSAAALLWISETLLLGPASRGMEFERLSYLQPLCLLGGALLLGSVALLLPRHGRPIRAGAGLALMAAGGVSIGFAVHGLIAGVAYVTGGPVTAGTTLEGRPFVVFGYAGLADSFGAGVPVLLAALALLAARAARERMARPGDTLILAWAGTMAFLSWSQYPRYAPDLAVPLCLAAGVMLGSPSRPRWPRLAAPLAFGLVLVAALPPVLRLRPTREHTVALFEGPARQVLLWARDHTPSAGIETRADRPPAYGVLAPWRYGFWIVWLGERPAVGTPFLLRPEERRANARAESLLLGDGTTAADLLAAQRLRYVLATPMIVYANRSDVPHRADGALLPTASYRRALNTRLLHDDGSDSGKDLPCLGNFRLLAESTESFFLGTAGPTPLPGAPVAAVKLFERVRGARLTGRAAPGSAVTATLGLRTPGGREFDFSCAARAGADGRFSIRLPYRSAGANGDGGTAAAGPWNVRREDAHFRVDVTEADVLTGAEKAIP